MKTLISILVVFITLNIQAQTKKFEVTNTKTGKSFFFENTQRVKIITVSREKFIGDLSIQNNEMISINGTEIKLDNIMSIKNYPIKGKKLKKIIFGTGLGLLASSGVAAAFGNGSAFTLFSVGAATTIFGGLLDNKNKTHLNNRNVFKIIE